MIKISLLVFIIAGFFGGASLGGQQAGGNLVEIADDLVVQIEKLRGLEAKAPIERGVSSRKEITSFLLRRIDEEYEGEYVQREEWLLKKLGVIPPDLDIKEFTVSILTEQVAGFYDQKMKKLFIADWLPVSLQKPTMVHELTHALQDQYYDLEQILNPDLALENEDEALARQAIIEGDALAVMMDYLLLPMGRKFTNINLDLLLQLEDVSIPSDILKSAPEFLKAKLTFPYQYGATFIQKVLADGGLWSKVDEIYSDMPVSTEQIMHPEKYLTDRDEPSAVQIDSSAMKLRKDWEVCYQNVFGELSLYLLLKLHTTDGEAKKAAAGWDGDRFYVVERGEADQRAILACTIWDSEEDAQEFYLAMTDWMRGRFPVAEKPEDEDGGSTFAVVYEGEYHRLQRDSNRVDFIIGLPEVEASRIQ